tara:strand:- start:1759 stop:2106 length:348 start_codon:yes stop_codon:yes gene_type:complete
MAAILWIVLATIIILGIIAIFTIKKSKKPHDPDYRTLFTLGLVFFVIGLGSQNSVMWILGLVFFIVGMAKKDKWKKQKKWSELSSSERNIKFLIIGGVVVALLLGILVVFLRNGA